MEVFEKINVVVVDDEEAFTIDVKATLENFKDHYAIEVFNDGPEFMRRLNYKEAPIDIAILDINMDNYSIVEAITKIRLNFKRTYIIIMSVEKSPFLVTELVNEYHIWGYAIKDASEKFRIELLRLVDKAETKIEFLRTIRNGRER